MTCRGLFIVINCVELYSRESVHLFQRECPPFLPERKPVPNACMQNEANGLRCKSNISLHDFEVISKNQFAFRMEHIKTKRFLINNAKNNKG